MAPVSPLPAGGRLREHIIIAAVVAAVCVGALAYRSLRPPADPAPVHCGARDFGWSVGDPAINRRHIFCGEIRDGEPKGFHSIQLRASADLVQRIERRGPERKGIYSAVVIFANGQRKFSTFFPDHCTVAEVEKSIDYAASGGSVPHPAWGMIGPSAPAERADGYCLDEEGRPFEVRFGRLPDGRVNTAFPN